MSLYAKLLLVNADPVPGAGPTGPPTGVTTTTYGGSLIRISWTNGDATAETYAYRQTGGEPLNLGFTDAGETTYDTGETDLGTYGVAHFKNGQYSAVVYEA